MPESLVAPSIDKRDEQQNITPGGELPSIYTTRLAFLHIEKTGGTSLTHYLEQFFPREEICEERGACFEYWLPAKLHNYRFFTAHTHYEDIKSIPGKCELVTVLRHPVSRALSYYEFLRHHDDNVAHADPRISVAKALDVSRFFFEAPRPTLHAMNNHMTALISSARRPFGKSALELAKRNLEKFLAVGVTEHLADFVKELDEKLGLRAVAGLQHVNVTAHMAASSATSGVGAIGPDVLARIEELNELDIELYEYACKTFVSPQLTQQCVPVSVNPVLTKNDTFEKEFVSVPSQHMGNVLYGPYFRLLPGRWSVEISVTAEPRGELPQVAKIDVFSQVAGRELAGATISLSETAWPTISIFTLTFETDVLLPDVEFRVWKTGPHRLVIRREVKLQRALLSQ